MDCNKLSRRVENINCQLQRRIRAFLMQPPFVGYSLHDRRISDEEADRILAPWFKTPPCCLRPGFARRMKVKYTQKALGFVAFRTRMRSMSDFNPIISTTVFPREASHAERKRRRRSTAGQTQKMSTSAALSVTSNSIESSKSDSANLVATCRGDFVDEAPTGVWAESGRPVPQPDPLQ